MLNREICCHYVNRSTKMLIRLEGTIVEPGSINVYEMIVSKVSACVAREARP